jgi:BirA family biotin operon repressor/biotin-[acetyl-CoA-carboxylase] ligase
MSEKSEPQGVRQPDSKGDAPPTIHASLLSAIDDGCAHSIRDIAARTELDSRAVVLAVGELCDVGCSLEIECEDGVLVQAATFASTTPRLVLAEGVRIRWPQPISILDVRRIEAAMSSIRRTDLASMRVRSIVTSTNAVLLNDTHDDLATNHPGDDDRLNVLLADAQSAGRGRAGRRWVSPFGCNIYMSLAFTWRRPLMELSGLSLAVGVAVCKALHALGVEDVRVKWPNDLLIDYQKLAGILIETTRSAQGEQRVVVGMGINVNANDDDGASIDQRWTSLARRSGHLYNRNEVAARLVDALADGVAQFRTGGLASFLDAWKHCDAFAGETVTATGPDGAVRGIASGIDERGRLLVAVGAEIIAIDAGDVSLRRDSGAE